MGGFPVPPEAISLAWLLVGDKRCSRKLATLLSWFEFSQSANSRVGAMEDGRIVGVRPRLCSGYPTTSVKRWEGQGGSNCSVFVGAIMTSSGAVRAMLHSTWDNKLTPRKILLF